MNLPLTTTIPMIVACLVGIAIVSLHVRRRTIKRGRERHQKAVDLALTHTAGDLRLLQAAALERRASPSSAMRERAKEEYALYTLAVEMIKSRQIKAPTP